MTVFLSGGCKNGKSTLAQRLAKSLAGSGALWYVATMIPQDEEDLARIRRHIQEREGWGFETLECGTGITKCLETVREADTILLDSVTALLSNEMFGLNGIFDPQAPERTARALLQLLDGVRNAVVVSDFLYADAGRYDYWTEVYRKGLAYVDAALAARSDVVAEACSGYVITHRGTLP